MSTRTLVPVLKYGLTGLLLRLKLRSAPNHYSPGRGGNAPEAARLLRAFGASAVRGVERLLPVIPKVCDLCHQQRLEKPASFYWAWVRADGRRKAYKQKLCTDCVREHFVALIAAAEDPILTCPACHISTADEYDAVYLTYCLPGMPKGQSEMPLCGACAVEVRNKALEGARELEDRGVGVGGPQPVAQTGAEVWAALGLKP